MKEMIKILIGVLVLLAGVPLGIVLAKKTKEELKSGQKWFKIIIALGLVGGIVGLIIQSDVLFFSFLFVAVVTSWSLKKKGK